jgi:hypothetical protein
VRPAARAQWSAFCLRYLLAYLIGSAVVWVVLANHVFRLSAATYSKDDATEQDDDAPHVPQHDAQFLYGRSYGSLLRHPADAR